MKLTPLLLTAFSLLLSGAAAPVAAAAERVTVAAAISLKEGLQDVAKAYAAETGVAVEFTFGSSGQLMAQVKNGAPIDVFVSAAAKQVDDLAREKLVDEATRRVVAGNALVLIVPAGAASPPTSLKDLADPRHRKVATGDPKTVPAGEYARQVLDALKLSDAVRDRTVHGSNVRQVLDYVERGEVAAGLVYHTDAVQAGPKVRVVERADPALHAPIEYPAAVVSASKRREAAGRFLDYLATGPAQRALAARGFTPPPAPPVRPGGPKE